MRKHVSHTIDHRIFCEELSKEKTGEFTPRFSADLTESYLITIMLVDAVNDPEDTLT